MCGSKIRREEEKGRREGVVYILAVVFIGNAGVDEETLAPIEAVVLQVRVRTREECAIDHDVLGGRVIAGDDGRRGSRRRRAGDGDAILFVVAMNGDAGDERRELMHK